MNQISINRLIGKEMKKHGNRRQCIDSLWVTKKEWIRVNHGNGLSVEIWRDVEKQCSRASYTNELHQISYWQECWFSVIIIIISLLTVGRSSSSGANSSQQKINIHYYNKIAYYKTPNCLNTTYIICSYTQNRSS